MFDCKICSLVTLQSMVAVTINRFVIIGFYKYYSRIYTPRNVNFMIAALWIFSFGMVMICENSTVLTATDLFSRFFLLWLIYGELWDLMKQHLAAQSKN